MSNEDAILVKVIDMGTQLGEIHGDVIEVKTDVRAIKEHYATKSKVIEEITKAFKNHKLSSHSIDAPGIQWSIRDVVKIGIFVGIVVSVVALAIMGKDISILFAGAGK